MTPPADPGVTADDAVLVARAQEGDRAALEELLRAHQERLHAVARRITGNEADALDATQEALIAIVRGLPRFDGRSRFSTWAYRITTNACIDELRRRRRRPLVGLVDGEGDDLEPIDPAPAVDVLVTDRLDVDAALAELPIEFRAPVVLRDLCRLDYAEIAEVLEIPPGTVRSRIARGRAQLAEHLGNQHPTPNRHTPAP